MSNDAYYKGLQGLQSQLQPNAGQSSATLGQH